jgi:hypothetical protein
MAHDTHRVWLLALLLVAAVPACRCDGSGSSRSDETASRAVAPSPTDWPDEPPSLGPDGAAATPRRPSRHYYVAHTGDRCAIYWEENDQRSALQELPCPREVGPNERIRLTGEVCYRDTGERERDVPVRCPARLVAREKADRLDAGLP